MDKNTKGRESLSEHGPWKCEGCGWTNLGYVVECDGCGEHYATASLDRAALAAKVRILSDRLDRALSYREGMEGLPEGTIPRA